MHQHSFREESVVEEGQVVERKAQSLAIAGVVFVVVVVVVIEEWIVVKQLEA